MSNILSINTVGSGTQISLQKSNEVFCCNIPFAKHSETLFPTLEKFLIDNDTTLNQLTALGVVTGPGSFTGIRIGMSVVKAFGYVFDIPCVAVNSLEVLAQGLNLQNGHKFCTTMNAGAEQIYYQIFEATKDNLKALTPPRVEEVKHFLSLCDQNPEMQVFCVDDVLEDFDVESQRVEFTPEGLNKAVQQHWKSGEVQSTNDLQPIYLRLAQGEVCHIVPEKLSVVKAMPTEFVALCDVDNQNDEWYVGWTQDEWKNKLLQANFECFEEVFGGTIVGLVGIETQGKVATIKRLIVDKKARNQGVAKHLLTQILHKLEQSGINNVELLIDSQNIPVLNLLVQFGFVKGAEYVDNQTKHKILQVKKDMF